MPILGIRYERGMLESVREKKVEEKYELAGDEIPRELLESIERNRLLELDGEYGDERVGEPVEYEHLLIETPERNVDIEVYNRGLMVFQYEQAGDLMRIHKVLNDLLDHFQPPE